MIYVQTFFLLDLPRGGLRANRGPEISHGAGEAVRVQADGSFTQIYSTHLSTRNGHGVIEKNGKILIEYHDLERALSGVLDSLWTTGVICNVVE
jgi:hypothetical protein